MLVVYDPVSVLDIRKSVHLVFEGLQKLIDLMLYFELVMYFSDVIIDPNAFVLSDKVKRIFVEGVLAEKLGIFEFYIHMQNFRIQKLHVENKNVYFGKAFTKNVINSIIFLNYFYFKRTAISWKIRIQICQSIACSDSKN